MAILFGVLFWWTALDLIDADGTLISIFVGGSLLLAAVGVNRSGRPVAPWWSPWILERDQ